MRAFDDSATTRGSCAAEEVKGREEEVAEGEKEREGNVGLAQSK